MFLAVVNSYLALHQTGQVRLLWRIASLSIVIKSVATYAYFVPVMIRRIERSAEAEAGALRRTISIWTLLSPMRIVVEMTAWITGIWALISISH